MLRIFKPYSLLLLGLVLTGPVLAQSQPTVHGDCVGAVYIKDSIVVCDRPGRGFGNILEVKENPITDLKWLEREHHTVWYLFRAPTTTLLTFDIIPQDAADDIDFLLFEGGLPDICNKIQRKEVVPVRSNISRNNTEMNSMCGLSKEATEDYVRSGVGASYSRAIDVKEGDLYYLLIDFPQRPRAGFTLHFHYDPPLPPPPPVVELPQALVINITDAATGAAVDAAITVEGMRFDSITKAKGKSQYEFRMDSYRKLRISCLRKGYMFHTERVGASGNDVVTVDIKLIPIESGAKVVLDDINFVGNDSKVLRNSEGSLYLLLHFLEQNPTTKVEIQGHVNGPTYKKNTKEFIELSTERAQAIYNFLIVNDVEPTRLNYVGLGNAHMLYPDPKNKQESDANRRVEVRIIGN